MVENLTEKQKKFCEEYIIDFNATQACIRSGYSEKTANRIGTENLSKLVIQTYIQSLIKQREKRTEITADMVVKELAKVAFHDIRKLYDENGNLLSVPQLDDDTASVISSFKSRREFMGKDEDGKPQYDIVDEYKRTDKMKALELLGKHLGMFDRTIKIEEETKTDTPMQITIIRDI